MNSPDQDIVAGVLVGGRSARMGSPKALLPVTPGVTFLEHVVGVARTAAGEVVLLGAADGIPAPLAGLVCLPDAPEAAGPVGGLVSLLEYAGDRWALLLACDMPRLDAGTLECLVTAEAERCDAVAYREPAGRRRFHACCALYHPRMLPALREALAGGRFDLQSLLGAARVKTLVPDERRSRALANVNTPEEYERFRAEQRVE